MASSHVQSGFEEFERRGLEEIFRHVLRVRIALLVVITAFALWLGLQDPAVWRRVLLGSLVVITAILDVYTRRRFNRHGYEPANMRLNTITMVAVQGFLLLATGGLASPIIPVMLPAAFGAGLLLGRSGTRLIVLGIQAPLLVGFASLHVTGALPSLVPTPFREPNATPLFSLLLLGGTMLILLVMFSLFGAAIREQTKSHLEQLATAQASALASHRNRADELTQLSAEIAHELKNPLASIKGLAQLLARSAGGDEDKRKHRLEVLQREAGRMQSILEEFLNFSRPLTPLNRTDVDLVAVCREVVALHEAMAADLSVRIRLLAKDDLHVSGDARKLAQILINLLHNALETSPAGATVDVMAGSEGEDVTIEVRDRGPGLRPEVASDVFEPGVTSKLEGHGLGLTIALGIAKQHGGTLSIKNAPEGGCVARLSLPRGTPKGEAA